MENKYIAIIGLGYVGLPLAVEFAKKYPVIGYDINTERIEGLRKGDDTTLEIQKDELRRVLRNENTIKNNKNGLYVSNLIEDISLAEYYIITVPTPIDKNNRPDLYPLKKASETIGSILKSGDIVIYESTVYPGATEDECVPILQKKSGLKYNEEFFVGYSPERINPGDKEHNVKKIKKVTSGSTEEVAKKIDDLYLSIIDAGTHKAPNIKVAEAAKVIENSQRDINIAFVNELAIIFNRLGIDTNDVLEAAGTKWNFLNFKPGLVGGHCIGVDPYYLAQKAQEVGYHPEIILAGRRLNDQMGKYVASEVIKLMISKSLCVKGSQVLILGITFKENCPDIRNSKVVDIIKELKEYGVCVEIYDPWADQDEVKHEYGVISLKKLNLKKYDAIIHAVAHKNFIGIDFRSLLKNESGVIYDVKGALDRKIVDVRL
jgi:UDP-N-acetyl-D-galactosamine dehydrogenase